MTEGQIVTRNIPVVQGQRVRVALAWSSHTSGTSNIGKSDVLRADLDLVDPPAEWVDGRIVLVRQLVRGRRLTASSTGTMRITVRHDRFDASQEPFGLAWALTSPFTDIGRSDLLRRDPLVGTAAITHRLHRHALLPRRLGHPRTDGDIP